MHHWYYTKFSQAHCYTSTLLHRHTATQAHCYTSTLLHRHTATQAHCYTGTLLHRHTATQAHCYTSTLLHRHTATQAQCTSRAIHASQPCVLYYMHHYITSYLPHRPPPTSPATSHPLHHQPPPIHYITSHLPPITSPATSTHYITSHLPPITSPATSPSPPDPPPSREEPMESISSMKMMEGACSLAITNSSLTMREPSPMYFCTSSEPDTLIKVHSVWCATALAKRVLPVPGGPNRSTPYKENGTQVRGMRSDLSMQPFINSIVSIYKCPIHWVTQCGYPLERRPDLHVAIHLYSTA